MAKSQNGYDMISLSVFKSKEQVQIFSDLGSFLSFLSIPTNSPNQTNRPPSSVGKQRSCFPLYSASTTDSYRQLLRLSITHRWSWLGDFFDVDQNVDRCAS